MSVMARVLVALSLFLLQACASELIRNPVPRELAGRAQIVNMPRVRFWGDKALPNQDQIFSKIVAQTKSGQSGLRKPGVKATFQYLAISGGGSDGAFGAGLLVGWSATGTRPQFKIVTGVSTGALAAPFAFLGSGYDRQLQEIYTAYKTKQLVKKHILAALLGGSSLASNSRLAKIIARYVDADLLSVIAREHAKGRRLLVGTTDLDAQRPVVWDMGAIASNGSPQALLLFRKVLLASSAVPGIFPPVQIDVVANGQTREEMHVDGGLTGQVFFLPTQLLLAAIDKKYGFRAKRKLYIIRNGKLTPEYATTEARVLPIASRSIATMIKNQGISDLYKIHSETERNKIEFNLAAIPPEFNKKNKESFDREYMSALFNTARTLAETGYLWAKGPPGLEDHK